MRRKLTGTLFYGACLPAIGILLPGPGRCCCSTSSSRGLPWLDVQFLTGVPSRRPAQRGHPAGPRRLARDRRHRRAASRSRSGSRRRSTSPSTPADSRLNRLLQTNISNLAGVPVDHLRHPRAWRVFVRLLGLGPTVLAAALTLTLLILPVVIIASIEALKAVPQRPARGRVRARGDALADGPRIGAAGRGAGHHDRHHPGHGPRDRRGGAADPDRRRSAFVTFLPNPRSRAATRCCPSRSSTGRSARRTTSRASRRPRSS